MPAVIMIKGYGKGTSLMVQWFESSPYNAGCVVRGTKILHVEQQLSMCATIIEACVPQQRAHMPKLRPDAAK